MRTHTLSRMFHVASFSSNPTNLFLICSMLLNPSRRLAQLKDIFLRLVRALQCEFLYFPIKFQVEVEKRPRAYFS